MRSIILHFEEASRSEIDEQLALWKKSEHYSDLLSVDYYDDAARATDAESLNLLYRELGWNPSISIVANVNERTSAKDEVLTFALFFLSRYRGVATEEITSHGWSLEEIRNGVKIQGNTFEAY